MRVNKKMWRYYLDGSPFGWGDFILTEDGNFFAMTDYGNYTYAWRSFGKQDFREFIVKCVKQSPEYLLEKFSRPEYCEWATKKSIKEWISYYRENGTLTSEEARREEELIERADLSSTQGVEDWAFKTNLPNPLDMSVEDYPRRAKHFVTELLPRLAKELEAELEAERKAVSA